MTTPYLIRNSDQLADWFERVAPAPLARWLDLYSRWVSELGARKGSFAFQLVRKWAWQIGLNLVLIAGVFIAASALRRWAAATWPEFPGGEDGIKAALWLGAMLLSLPLIIAVFRKMRALALLLSEMSVSHTAGGANTAVLRSVVANTISAAGSVGLVLLILLLSSAILPSWKLFVAQALIVAAAAVLLRRAFVKLYSKAQFALLETLTQPPPAPNAAAARALPPILREAGLTTLVLPAASVYHGKLIGELRLRTLTGASIVGIQRDGMNLVNPGPDEEMRHGDELLLLGSEAHLDSARKFFEK